MVVSAVRPGSTTLLLIYGNGKQETININVYARAPQASAPSSRRCSRG